MNFKSLVTLIVIFGIVGVVNADIANFDDLALSPDSYWNGSDETGDFTSGSAVFNNNYDSTSDSWDGWAYSNKSDTTTAGYTNQYSAITGLAQSGSNYGIAYIGWTEPPSITLSNEGVVEGIYVTNTTYAALDMLQGSGFSKKFGGDDGSDEDWFKLTITGKDVSEVITGTVDFYLADYRFENNEYDYIVDSWEYVDLGSLGVVKMLEFSLSSSDVGKYGMNTPAYFAMDTVIPEPATIVMFCLGGLLFRRERKSKC
ncbi:MAG: PEP-CTERM sorting domain-containing protein [Planctomycetes bacterium HGW-Planctomycetes-1]|nr:MAG: PEP-CTERM sorting domain-containing protein [Planctomycetes bacterium HGW-Planctomycetes-1]